MSLQMMEFEVLVNVEKIADNSLSLIELGVSWRNVEVVDGDIKFV